MTYEPTQDLVVVGWLKGITALQNGVATVLPAPSSWPTMGTPAGPFFVVATVIGGESDSELPIDMPVVSVDVWAANIDGATPPWARAAQVCEVIRKAVRTHSTVPRKVTMPTGYADAYVSQAWLPGPPPRRVPSDEAGYAHAVFELGLSWGAT
jgi:hypothetical protein